MPRRAPRLTGVVLVVAGAVVCLTGCGSDAPDLPTPPLSRQELVGRWTSPGAGSVRFDADGSFEAVDVPHRAVGGGSRVGTDPVDVSGTWSIPDQTGPGWKHIEVSSSDGGAPDWMVRGARGHRELDMVVGDPDQVDWVRFRPVPGA